MTAWALKLTAAVWAALMAWFVGANVVGPMFGVLVVFIALDWLTGLRAATHEGEPLESAKLSRTGEKLVNKGTGMVVLWILGLGLPGFGNVGYALPVAYLGYEIATEAWSIFENMARCGDALPGFITRRVKGILDAQEDPPEQSANG